MINIKFTEQEIRVLSELINISVKAWWLEVAEAWVVLNKKLLEAVKNQNKKIEEKAVSKESKK